MEAISISAARFSPDYRIASWDGEVFEFSAQQAAVVRAIADAHAEGLPAVRGNLILDTISADGFFPNRIDEVFRAGGKRHPAWNRFVMRCGRNVYRLNFEMPQKSHISATVLESEGE